MTDHCRCDTVWILTLSYYVTLPVTNSMADLAPVYCYCSIIALVMGTCLFMLAACNCNLSPPTVLFFMMALSLSFYLEISIIRMLDATLKVYISCLTLLIKYENQRLLEIAHPMHHPLAEPQPGHHLCPTWSCLCLALKYEHYELCKYYIFTYCVNMLYMLFSLYRVWVAWYCI